MVWLAETLISLISEVLSSCIVFEYQPGMKKKEVLNDMKSTTQNVEMCMSLPVSTFQDQACNENDGWELLEKTTYS